MLLAMASKATEELWAERVRAWRASGLDAHAFAAGKGFAGSTLAWRARELRQRRQPTVTGVGLRRIVRHSDPKPLPAPTPRLASADSVLVVRVGSAELVVAPGFDAELVRALVRCLVEAAS